ncbi:MAG: SIMPL domain-containing protein [Alphaproteobacteria bacterium]|nr:SIMPL domain-containing protein [Alphaproteobacteria bacterium]
MIKSENVKPIHIIFLGLAISIGPGLGGFFIGKAIDRFKASDKSVTVKGLSERIVESNESHVAIKIQEKTDDIAVTANKVQEDAVNVKKMLVDAGFKMEEIKENVDIKEERLPYSESEKAFYKKYQYKLELSLSVYDKNAVEKFQKELLILNTAGKMLNVKAKQLHAFTKIEEIRAPMLAEATKSARAMADQFAKDSGTRVGGILKASQGSFTITGEKDTSASEHYSRDTPVSFKKRVRVVSHITFRLE